MRENAKFRNPDLVPNSQDSLTIINYSLVFYYFLGIWRRCVDQIGSYKEIEGDRLI